MRQEYILPGIFFVSVFIIMLSIVLREKTEINARSEIFFNRVASVLQEDATVRPINVQEDLVRGNPDAEVVIIEYGDLQCPFCYRQHPVFQQLIRSDYVLSGAVTWVFRHFPHIDNVSDRKARFVECVRREYGNKIAWQFLDRMIANLPTINDDPIGDDRFPPRTLPGIHRDIEILEGVDIDLEGLFACEKNDESVLTAVESAEEEAYSLGATQTPYTIILSKRFGINSRSSRIYSFTEIESIIQQILQHSLITDENV